MGVAALILGIISVVIGCFFSYIGWIGIILGVAAVINEPIIAMEDAENTCKKALEVIKIITK